MVGIKVTDMDGNRISFPTALVRAIFKFGLIFAAGFGRLIASSLHGLSFVPVLNAFLIVLTEKQQTIHDYIAGTIVVKK